MAEPKIIASFILDDDGSPRFEIDDEDNALKHYDIELKVEEAPETVYIATFELDPTYYDPIRTVPRKSGGALKLDTSSYGDYVVTVNLRSKDDALFPIKTSLSRALKDSYPGVLTPALRRALKDISEN